MTQKRARAQAQVVPKNDPRLYVEDIKYPGETGEILAHFARPKRDLKLPGVVVIHENSQTRRIGGIFSDCPKRLIALRGNSRRRR
jgi:hypothetical protein